MRKEFKNLNWNKFIKKVCNYSKDIADTIECIKNSAWDVDCTRTMSLFIKGADSEQSTGAMYFKLPFEEKVFEKTEKGTLEVVAFSFYTKGFKIFYDSQTKNGYIEH